MKWTSYSLYPKNSYLASLRTLAWYLPDLPPAGGQLEASTLSAGSPRCGEAGACRGACAPQSVLQSLDMLPLDSQPMATGGWLYSSAKGFECPQILLPMGSSWIPQDECISCISTGWVYMITWSAFKSQVWCSSLVKLLHLSKLMSSSLRKGGIRQWGKKAI